MKYAVKFYRGARALKDADEIIVKYFEKSETIIKFVQEKPESVRIVLNVAVLPEEEFLPSLEIFKAAATAHKNFAILCSKLQPYQELAENNLSFFFIEGAGTFDELYAQYKLGVSDIYIIDELGFYLKDIKENFGNFVNIRVIPNIAQSSSEDYVEDFKKFFIRPDDLEAYENYIDIIEFAGPLNTQSVYCDIYKDGRWQGELEDLIINFDAHVHCMNVVPNFGTARLNCKKRCSLRKCNICDNIQDAAELLRSKDIYINKRKKVYENVSDTQPIEEVE